jgi:hypothetical protein
MIVMNANLNDILVAYLKYVLVMIDNLNDRYEWFVVSSLFNLNLICMIIIYIFYLYYGNSLGTCHHISKVGVGSTSPSESMHHPFGNDAPHIKL